jgi:hypothetical protein
LLGASFSGKSAAKVGYSTIGDTGDSITVDSAGNIYITGSYNSSTTVPINTFGANPTASPYILPVTTGVDVFVIKWNAGGTVAGYSTIKGTGADTGQSIAVDSAGNIYITGRYISTTTVPINTFGTAPTASGVSMPITTTSNAADVFVIKWNGSNGAVAGYTYLNGNSADIGYGIAVDSSQNIYITGQYNSTVAIPIRTFGTAPTPTNAQLPNVGGGANVFVIKWLANGALTGFTYFNGTSVDIGYGIAVDSNQNIYITGQYTSTTTVPIRTFAAVNPAPSGVSMPITTGTTSDAFVIKWLANGTVAGYSTIKGSGTDRAYGIAVDSSQNIYVTGLYQSTGTVPINTFGTAPTPSGFSMPASSLVDTFVIKWSGSNGTVAGYTYLMGTENDSGRSIAVDSAGNIYITGQYVSLLTVPINTFSTAPTASGVSLPASLGLDFNDTFVIKWSGSNGTVAGYTYLRGTNNDSGNGIAVDSAGNIYVTGQYISTGTVPINTFGTAPVASGSSLPITAETVTDAFVIKWNA